MDSVDLWEFFGVENFQKTGSTVKIGKNGKMPRFTKNQLFVAFSIFVTDNYKNNSVNYEIMRNF